MRSPKLSLIISLAVVSTVSAGSAKAAEPCFFQSHEPHAIRAMLDSVFDQNGLFYLPAGFTGLGEGFGNTDTLFRGPNVVANMALNSDVYRDQQDFTVMDARGEWLLKAKKRTYTCGDALCQDIEIKPRREAMNYHPEPIDDFGAEGGGDDEVLPQQRSPFFMRWRFPDPMPLQTWAFGREVSPPVFEFALQDSYKWLAEALLATDVTMPVRLTGAVSQLQFALVRDPMMRPYFPTVHYGMVAGGVVVSGRVPSDEHYYRAVDIAREQGLWVRDITLVIDSRMQLPPAREAPMMCN